LFLGTKADNVFDKYNKQRQARGHRIAASKLNESDIREIREFLAKGISKRRLAMVYGISRRTILDVEIGKTWAWLS